MNALQLPEIARAPAHHAPDELCIDECCLSQRQLADLRERLRDRVLKALQQCFAPVN